MRVKIKARTTRGIMKFDMDDSFKYKQTNLLLANLIRWLIFKLGRKVNFEPFK